MPTYDLLLVIGITLCLLAVMLRGMHQDNLRSAALRAQAARHARIAGSEDTLNATLPPPHPLARRLPFVYRTTLLIGMVTTIWAYWNR